MKKISHFLTNIVFVVLLTTCIISLTACKRGDDKEYKKNPLLDVNKDVVLKLVSNKETWPEFEEIIAKFEEIYPNCTIDYENIEEYANVLKTRLDQDEQKVDIFTTVNIQGDNPLNENAYNLISEDAKKYLDLSNCYEGLVANFKYIGADNTQYAIPYGGEMRGMYVNVSLLKELNLEVPTNRSELLECCKVLLENGYIPMQSSSGTFAQQLLYPYICNTIVNGGNYEEMYEKVDEIEPGISEYFRDAYSFIYEIVEKGYFDYKRVERETGYTFNSSDGKAKDFLNIMKVSDDTYEKKDDLGAIAFMPDTQAFQLHLDKNKSDYHSAIEYKFITSPVGEDGGYAYLSPSDGFAVNKKSDNIDWALEFLNFFFTPENNKEFALKTGKIPNTKDALMTYDIPSDRASNVGQVTFSYRFYQTVTTLMGNGYDDMVGISKMNNTKYMTANIDGTYSLAYSLDDYMARLELEFQKVEESRK